MKQLWHTQCLEVWFINTTTIINDFNHFTTVVLQADIYNQHNSLICSLTHRNHITAIILQTIQIYIQLHTKHNHSNYFSCLTSLLLITLADFVGYRNKATKCTNNTNNKMTTAIRYLYLYTFKNPSQTCLNISFHLPELLFWTTTVK